MAISAFLQFKPYNANILANPIPASSLQGDGGTYFKILDYSLDVEQTLNIGSQSSGAGAGKITFNPLSVVRHSDTLTPILFQQACSGTAFAMVKLFLYNDTTLVSTFIFKLVAVKGITFAPGDDGASSETITFEFGGMQIATAQLNTHGGLTGNVVLRGWNRVKNMADTGTANIN